jgi:hypothetical protein
MNGFRKYTEQGDYDEKSYSSFHFGTGSVFRHGFDCGGRMQL